MTSGDPFTEVVNRLSGVRSASAVKVMALCPVHEADGREHTPSFSVSTGTSGKVLLKCFAKCTFEELRDALERLGLPLGILSAIRLRCPARHPWPEPPSRPRRPPFPSG